METQLDDHSYLQDEAIRLFLSDKELGTVLYANWNEVPAAVKEHYLAQARLVLENEHRIIEES